MRRAAVLMATAVVLAGCSAGSGSGSTQPAGDGCVDLVVLGLRGQGQSARTHQGVGAEVERAAMALTARLDDKRVQLEAIRYPAELTPTMAAFDRNVATGVRLLTRRLIALAADCPSTRYAVVGFSAGAAVAHRAVSAIPADEAADIAVVAVLGDPFRDPTDDVRTETFGRGDLTGRGSLAPGPRWSAAIRERVVTFCTPKDNVCNAPLDGRGGAPISDAHRSFYEKESSGRVIGRRMAQTMHLQE